jgi:hypothetical protein
LEIDVTADRSQRRQHGGRVLVQELIGAYDGNGELSGF